MKNKKVVFFDLDGTLLTRDLSVAPSSIEAIHELKSCGVEPIIATGRTLMEIDYVLKATGITSCVAMNGQYVLYNGEVIYENPLNKKEVTELHVDAKKNGHEMAFYNADKITVTAEGSILITKNYERVGGNYPPLDDRLYLDEPIHLMLIFCEPGEEAYYQKQFPNFQFIRNSPYGCDIYPAGSSKATGIERLISHLELSLENTYAFGDGLNDLEMFDLVKHSVAMGNALDIVKKSASYITSSHNNNGIAEGLQALGLLDKSISK